MSRGATWVHHYHVRVEQEGQAQPSSNWNHGYQQLCVRLSGGGLMWVSPNQVPAGFRRDGDRIITTTETALRLPAEPSCQLIVTCTAAGAEPREMHSAPPVTGMRPLTGDNLALLELRERKIKG